MVTASTRLLMSGALSPAGHYIRAIGEEESHKNYISSLFIPLLTFISLSPALLLIQLCRLPEDLAAFPDADGHHPHGGPDP